ncbi:glycosyltransferase [Metapseudomonas otitidis]|uniref:glycosyltransferase n=1 Tax=Metapseudomonas otitidis TaxID=319939 RepID=UPI0013F68530|nr:glycosyltransferase [Pseudomonas otitidis]
MGTELAQAGVLDESASPCPRFAVLLAAYNGMQWLPEQLDSILSQVGVDVTVYVSTDKSNDGTHAWVCDMADTDPRVVPLIYGEVFGGAAKNFFRLLRDVDFERFDYIAFADQDDIWIPDKLDRAHRHIVSRGCDGYSSNVMAFWPDGRRTLVNKSQAQVKWDYHFEAAGPGCTYVMTTALAVAIKHCVINHRRRVDDVALHDWFCYAFARARGYRWYIDATPSLLYRQHKNNQFGVNSGFKAFQSRANQVFNGWWLAQVRLISSILETRDLTLILRLDTSYRMALFCLSLRSWQCRRRLRDKLFFALICWALVFKGPDNG